MNAIELLRAAVESYEPWLQPTGHLHDPVLREPTGAGTPHHALAQAVLASIDPGPRRADHLMNAFRGLDASLRHLLDPRRAPPTARIDPATGAIRATDAAPGCWAPILKTFRLLKRQGVSMVDAFASPISTVDAEQQFPDPPGWADAASWLEGEWIRTQEGLGGISRAAFEHRLAALLNGCAVSAPGYCQQPGQSNACDLLIRLHLAGLLHAGYDGDARPALETLLRTGLARSLAVQLSDGSLASTHAHGGQTWTVAAQIAYFTLASRLLAEKQPAAAADALAAAQRAMASLARWQRPDDPFSPVENLHPPAHRIGYDDRTFDGHGASVAIAMLAEAVLHGLDQCPLPPRNGRPHAHFIEEDPVGRALVQGGPYSVHVNAAPADPHDAFGLADITFGSQRYFHLVGPVHHAATGRRVTPGMALRTGPGRTTLRPIGEEHPRLIAPIQRGLSDASIRVSARCPGAVHLYELNVWLDDDGIEIEERTPGLAGYKSLLLPYPRDMGGDYRTHVRAALSPEGAVVRFRYGNELIRLRVQGAISHSLLLPHGYESRRGLCGLLRLDLRDPTEIVRYRLSVVR
jgi:hypothetical protein